MRVSLVSKLTTAWLTGVAILVAVIAAALRFTDGVRAAETRVAGSHVVLEALATARARLHEIESAHRGYLLTGASAQQAAYWRGVALVPGELAALRHAVRDGSVDGERHRGHLARLDTLVRDALALQARALAAREGRRTTAAAALVGSPNAARLADGTRGTLDALDAAERRVLAARVQALDRATARTERVMWCAVALVVVFAPLGYATLLADVRARRRAEDALAAESVTDPLTGLLNRRGFEHVGAHALAHATRSREPALLLYLDMNGFKPINDDRGHAAGDAALRDVASALRSVFRDGDVLARVGGDEFAILACDASEWDAGLLAARIDDALRTRSWGDAPYAPHRLRASVGVAAFDPHAPVPLTTLVHDADASMYAVKHLARVPA